MKKLILSIVVVIMLFGNSWAINPPGEYPTKNRLAKSVNAYLGKQKKEPFIQFHSNQARVKFIILSGLFVTGLILFFKNMPKKG